MHKWILAGFGAVLFILIVNGLVAYRNLQTLIENDRLVTHTHEVQSEIDSLLTDLKDLGAGQVGYLMTGDEQYLAVYEGLGQRIPERLQRLGELISDNAGQRERLARLQPLVASRMELLSSLANIRREKGFDAARDELLVGQGRGQMGEIRQLVGEMQQEETRLLDERTRQSRTSARRLVMMFVVATLLDVGAVACVFWLYHRDLGQRQQTDEPLARLAAIVSSADDAIISKDLNGVITSWNSGAERLYGYTAAEAVGQNIRLIIPESRSDEEYEILARLKRGWRIEHLETERRHKDGHIIPVSLTISPIRDATDKVVGASKIARDITERKRTERELRQAHEKLEQRVVERTAELEAANKELEAFSYTVSHDLRAPLRAIDGFSRILLDEFAAALPPECQDYLCDVRANTQQMGRLVDDLLTFSRLSRQPLKKQPIDAGDVARQVFDELLTDVYEGRPELRMSELPACWGDPALVKQIWSNLLSNAIKYTSKQSQPTIEIGSTNGDAREHTYFVKDNGVGFDMKYAHKLFGVFQRLHRAEDYEGTGVGLAIVQRIVHRHGGRVWADARPGEGATFYFTLPAVETFHA